MSGDHIICAGFVYRCSKKTVTTMYCVICVGFNVYSILIDESEQSRLGNG